jgi:hypothetical protein
MKKSALLALCAVSCLLSSPVLAQSAAGAISGSTSNSASASTSSPVTTQIQADTSASQSHSNATAINGAQSTSSPTVTVTPTSTNGATNGAATSANSQNITFTSPPASNHSSITTVPDVVAPALATTLTETCMGSTSAGLSLMGGGGSFGTTWNDKECVDRLNARELFSYGFREEACWVMRNDPIVEAAFVKTGRPCAPPPPPMAMNQPLTVPVPPAPPAPAYVPANTPAPAGAGDRDLVAPAK